MEGARAAASVVRSAAHSQHPPAKSYRHDVRSVIMAEGGENLAHRYP
jgi:hypothetical protein